MSEEKFLKEGKLRSETRRGAFSGGQIQIVVNASRDAKKRLEQNKGLNDAERKRLQGIADWGESAEILLREHREKFGFDEKET